jgi:NADH-quinone oxidoreductase subunit M
VFGTLAGPQLLHMPDMSAREMAALVPLVYFTIHFGVYPGAVLDIFSASVESLLTGLQISGVATEIPGQAAANIGIAQ